MSKEPKHIRRLKRLRKLPDTAKFWHIVGDERHVLKSSDVVQLLQDLQGAQADLASARRTSDVHQQRADELMRQFAQDFGVEEEYHNTWTRPDAIELVRTTAVEKNRQLADKVTELHEEVMQLRRELPDFEGESTRRGLEIHRLKAVLRNTETKLYNASRRADTAERLHREAVRQIVSLQGTLRDTEKARDRYMPVYDAVGEFIEQEREEVVPLDYDSVKDWLRDFVGWRSAPAEDPSGVPGWTKLTQELGVYVAMVQQQLRDEFAKLKDELEQPR